MQKFWIAFMAAFGFALAGCDVEQTQEGELPEVDVEGGEAPAYDVETPEVDVGTQEEQVTVPDVDIGTEEQTVTTPEIDVEPAQ